MKLMREITLDGMLLDSDLTTGNAFGNCDRFVENFSGKDTLHDIVGKSYQIISEPQQDEAPVTCEIKDLEEKAIKNQKQRR